MTDKPGIDAVERAAAELRDVLDAMTHPLRVRLASELRRTPGQGAEELAEAVEEPVRRVRHQLKVLSEAGLVEVEREERRRNVRKRFYALAAVPLEIDPDSEAALPEAVRSRIVGTLLQALVADALASLEAGVFIRRRDKFLIRMPARVDERGWKELTEVYYRAWEEAERIGAESARRLEEGEGQGVPITGALLLFEMPESP